MTNKSLIMQIQNTRQCILGIDKLLTDIENVVSTPICEDCEPTDLETAKQKMRLMASECNRYMKHYEELVKENAELKLCKGKELSLQDSQILSHEVLEKIDKLEQDVKEAVNELCLKCGNYKDEHLGRCDGCKWKEKRNVEVHTKTTT